MIINKKIRRTILENKSQYLGSFALIVLSCLLFTLLNQLSDNMSRLTGSFERNYVQEDANFTTGSRLNNIEELESKFNAVIEEGASLDYSLSGDKTLRIFRENNKVNIPAIVEGNGLTGNDILIDPAFAKANNLKVGSGIKVFGKTFRIAGFMSLPNYIYPLKSENDIMISPESFGTAVVGKENFNEFNKGNSFYSIRFNSSNTGKDTQASRFRDYLRSKNVIVSQWSDIGDNKRVTFVTAKIQGISEVSSAMPIAILLLTCVLTGIVIWRMLSRESAVIGTLYAQGYRRGEINRHYMAYPLIAAIAGGITGTIFGALLLKPMLGFMVEYFNIPVDSISFNPVYVAVSLLLPVIFLGVSGYLVLSRQLRHSPVELIRGATRKNRVNFIESRLTLNRLNFSAKFKIREQLRSLSRLVFLLVGVVMATMLLLLGFTAKSSLDYLLNDSVRNTFKFEHEYVYNSLHTEQVPSGAEAFSASTFNINGSKLDFEICGVNPTSSYISLKDKKGAELGTDKVVITKPLAEKLKVKPGDMLRVVNKLDLKEYEVTVSSIAETYIGEYIFIPLAEFNSMLGYPDGSYIGLWSKEKLDIPEKLLYRSQTVDDSIKALNASMQPLQATMGVLALMAFIIGIIVIYVVTSLIIEENRGNISLMKVFGYRRKEVNSLILNSSVYVIVIGYIIGIPLLMGSLDAMFKSLTDSLNLTLPVKIDYPYIIVGFAAVYLTYELSKALSKKKIARIPMSEALKAGTE